jgi:HJR/Mrr/RecB family endonuclease
VKPIFYRQFVHDNPHGKVWNVVIKYMKRHGMWRTFTNCNGDYSEDVRLEIKTQQLTLNQDKQNEHNLNPTM